MLARTRIVGVPTVVQLSCALCICSESVHTHKDRMLSSAGSYKPHLTTHAQITGKLHFPQWNRYIDVTRQTEAAHYRDKKIKLLNTVNKNNGQC